MSTSTSATAAVTTIAPQSMQELRRLWEGLSELKGDEHNWVTCSVAFSGITYNVTEQVEHSDDPDVQPDVWVALTVPSIRVGSIELNLGDHVEGHITLGNWRHQSTKWGRQYARALAMLQADVEMRMQINQDCSNEFLTIFRFHVSSIGGGHVKQMESLFHSGCVMHPGSLRRQMSPLSGYCGSYGPVFHLSVRPL